MSGDPIYRAPAPLAEEQYAELAASMGLDPYPEPDDPRDTITK